MINKENNKGGPKFGDYVRISKYLFAKGYVPNWSEKILVIKEVKNTVPWIYITSDFKGEEIVGMFYKKKLQKANQKGFRVEKVTTKMIN